MTADFFTPLGEQEGMVSALIATAFKVDRVHRRR